MIVAGSKDAILMVEAGAKEVTEEEMIKAILFAHEEIKKIIDFQTEIIQAVGKPKKDIPYYRPNEELKEAMYGESLELLKNAVSGPDKATREDNIDKVKDVIKEKYLAFVSDNATDITKFSQSTESNHSRYDCASEYSPRRKNSRRNQTNYL